MADTWGIYASEDRFDLQRMVGYWARIHPEKAVLKEQGRAISYQAFDDLINKLAFGLRERGVNKGDAVVSALPNYSEAAALFFAVAKLGAVLVPCNSLSGTKEAADHVLLTDPKVVFVSCPEAVDLVRVCNKSCLIVAVRFEDDRCLSFSNLLARCHMPFVPATVDPHQDTLAVVFTSGSTGEPKGVEQTYLSLFASGYNYGEAMQVTSGDVFAMPMPVSHLFGLNAGVILPVLNGATILLVNKFVPEDMLSLVERERATVLYGVPTMFARELEVFDNQSFDMSSLRTGLVGGANCPQSLIERIREDLHCNVVVGYGSTEAGAISATGMEDSPALVTTTVGRAFNNVRVGVVSKEGDIRTRGEGELVCSSPCIMKGFYRQLEKTAKVLRNGWIYTGDAASIDEYGYIRVLGRIDGMIIRGGYNIYPSELEHVYSAHDDVIECCAFSVPHDVLGQQSCLVVKLKEGSCEDAKTLREYARGRIAKYKIPDHVVVVDHIPRLPTGKFDMNAVRKLGETI